MPRHSDSLVSRIKQAVDLITLVGDYGLTLHRAGSRFKALCPFHDDHRPSLDLNPERQSFKCWACGAGGDVFDFVQRFERVEFPEALRMLAERAGIALESEPRSEAPAGPTKSELREVCAWAQGQFQSAYAESSTAQGYVAARGIDARQVASFGLGYSPDSRDWLIQRAGRAGIPVARLEAAGLVGRNDEGTLVRERFRGRLIFPIFDWQGRVVGFGGRILPELEKSRADEGFQVAKYLNSPETQLFQKRSNLYGIHLARAEARRKGWVAVVEGYTDVIAAHQVGLTNVVGTLGTALGDEHITWLRRLAPRAVLVFDGDEAGQKAAERALELFLGHEIDVRVLVLHEGIDPCDFLLSQGAEPFLALVERAVDPLEFALARCAARFDLNSSEGTRQASEWVLSLLSRVPRTSRAGLDVKLAKALDVVARRLRLPVDPLHQRLRALRRSARRNAPSSAPASTREPGTTPSVSGSSPESPTSSPRKDDRLVAEILSVVLNEPRLVERVAERVAPEHVADQPHRTILEACYSLWRDGLEPLPELVAERVGPGERALVGRLVELLQVEPQPLSTRFGRFEPASWDQRLEAALRQLDERAWRERVRRMQDELAAFDRTQRPDEYQALHIEYLKLYQQRPDTRKTPAS